MPSCPTLNRYELTSIYALLAYAAHHQSLQEENIRNAIKERFFINDIAELSAHSYGDVIRFLIDMD